MPISVNPEIRKIDNEGIFSKPLLERGIWTPDFHHLRQYEAIPLFVYGKYQKNGVNKHILEGAQFISNAHTLLARFEMKEDDYSNATVFAYSNNEEPKKQKYNIKGELWAVNVEHIHILDRRARNGQQYIRIKTKISIENPNALPDDGRRYRGLPYIEAYIYVGNPEYYKDKKLYSENVKQFPMHQDLKNLSFQEYDHTIAHMRMQARLDGNKAHADLTKEMEEAWGDYPYRGSARLLN